MARRAPPRERKNPFGVQINLTEMVLLGAGIWFVASEHGQSILNTLFPPLTSTTTGGTTRGGAGGVVTNPNTGQQQVAVPRTPHFVLDRVNWDAGPLQPGSEVRWLMAYFHTGPAGNYVLGLELRKGSQFFGLVRGQTIQLYEVDVTVEADPVPELYSVGGTGRFSTDQSVWQLIAGAFGTPSALEARYYLRDANGRVYLEIWGGVSLGVVV